MKYYKVKREYDNKYFLIKKKYWFLIGDELYTVKEREKLPIGDEAFEIINLNKNNTRNTFGARFQIR